MGEWVIYVRRDPDGWEAGFRKGGTSIPRARALTYQALAEGGLPTLFAILDADNAQEEIERLVS